MTNGVIRVALERDTTGLIGFAAQIRRSSLIGSCAMETAEHREPCESRGSRTDLGAPGGEIPPGDSTEAAVRCAAAIRQQLGGIADLPGCMLETTQLTCPYFAK